MLPLLRFRLNVFRLVEKWKREGDQSVSSSEVKRAIDVQDGGDARTEGRTVNPHEVSDGRTDVSYYFENIF